jgi:hypothetical protein
MARSKGPGPAAERIAAQRAAELDKLIRFATQIAQGWAESLAVGDKKVEWVAIQGRSRTPISGAAAAAVVHPLEHDAGIAFVLGSTGLMDLLFVVTARGGTYSVNISNHARPWEQSEHLRAHPDHAGDRQRVLRVAARYARQGAR